MRMRNKIILSKEIAAFTNRYVLRPDVEDTIYIFQYHVDFWGHAEDESVENALWADFLNCAVHIMASLGDGYSTITAMGISGVHRASAKLEQWYDAPPLSGLLLPSNYGMDVCILTQGVPARMLGEFFNAVTLGINESHSVTVFGRPLCENLVQQEEWLATLSETEQPLFCMQLTHHPMLKIKYDAAHITQEQIVCIVEQTMNDLHKELELRV